MKINNKQIGIIKMAQKQIGMDDPAYRALLSDEFNRTSCTKLTSVEADRLIDIMKEKGFNLVAKKTGWRSSAPHQATSRTAKGGAKVVKLASPAERSKVAAVASLIVWKAENGLELYLAKRCNIKNGKVVTSQDAYLAIEALKKMFENGMKKDLGHDWWLMKFEDEKVMEYIRIHAPKEYN